MKLIDAIKELLNTFTKKERYTGREMKRVFQWRRYFQWKDLTQSEKLSAKRLFFVPIAAYFIFVFINQYAFTLIFLICLYFAYKKFDKGKLTK